MSLKSFALCYKGEKNVFLVWRFVVLEIFPVILHCPIWFTILTILIDFNKVWPYSFSLPNNVYNPNNDYNPFLIFLRMDLIRLPHTHPRLTSLSYCTFHWVGNKQHTYKVYYSVQCGKLKKRLFEEFWMKIHILAWHNILIHIFKLAQRKTPGSNCLSLGSKIYWYIGSNGINYLKKTYTQSPHCKSNCVKH